MNKCYPLKLTIVFFSRFRDRWSKAHVWDDINHHIVHTLNNVLTVIEFDHTQFLTRTLITPTNHIFHTHKQSC